MGSRSQEDSVSVEVLCALAPGGGGGGESGGDRSGEEVR